MVDIEIFGASDQHKTILNDDAVHFVAQLFLRFGGSIQAILDDRKLVQQEIDSGILPSFRADTRNIREASWQVVDAPADIQDRTVEITGPPVRKMVINALNSGANVFMADFEDSHCPEWAATLDGQINVYDAIRNQIDFESNGKKYQLKEDHAVLMVRPRGWHLTEDNFVVNGQPVPGALVDFGLYFFNNAKRLLQNGSGPYFYLPKLECHEEARLWAEIFHFSEEWLGVPKSSIRATVLIETITAVFEMEEILYELREYSAGLNCGRWDYIFSFIKKFRNNPDFVLPDRSQVTMKTPCMAAYSELLIRTCHRRNAFAMGGMAAQIPIRDDVEANEEAMNKVEADKAREAYAGHDGTWVAHPGLIGIARNAFEELYPEMPNRLHIKKKFSGEPIGAHQLLEVPQGTITEQGVKTNVDVGLQYIDAWLKGNGCVALYNLMEDAATAEISRAQLWQWIRHSVSTDTGRLVSDVYKEAVDQAVEQFELSDDAVNLFNKLVSDEQFEEFLTVPAYRILNGGQE